MVHSRIHKAASVLFRRDDSFGDCVDMNPGRHGHVPIQACNAYYNYDPEFAPAVAVAVIFGLLLGAHIGLGIYTKKTYTWVVIMSALWETLAFILHSVGSLDQQNSGYAIGWQLLFLLAPLWVNAFVYMTFARMVLFYYQEEKLMGIRAQWITKMYVWADFAAFLVQAAGGSMLNPGGDPDTIKLGLNIYLGGMGIQQFFICTFVFILVQFHRSMLRTEMTKNGWKMATYTLYAALIAITVRNIFRIAEFAPGMKLSNPIPFHEAYSYALDAFPMMIALLILAIWHPGRVLIGPESEFPSYKERRAERKAIKAEKKTQKEEKKKKRMRAELKSRKKMSADSAVENLV